MKIRHGFVSNSSSASFIIIIEKPVKEVISLWEKNCEPLSFLEEEFKKSVEEKLLHIEKLKTEKGISYFSEEEAKLKSILTYLQNKEVSIIPLVADYSGILIEGVENKTILKKELAMFNSYLDLGNLLIDFLLYLKDLDIEYSLKSYKD